MSARAKSNRSSVAGLPSVRVGDLHHTIGEVIVDKLPAFLYLLAEDYTLQYTNEYFHRQFGKTDESTPCYFVMRGRTSPCDPCPAQTVFKERSEQVWIWQDNLRGQLYEVHEYPYSIDKGRILVLGLGINISGQKKTRKEREIAQGCQDVLRICSHCKDINKDRDNGDWEHIETYLKKTNGMEFSHGICPGCLVKYYPDAAKIILRK
jgi:hypothetical protein